MNELVVASKRQLDRNAKGLDRHDGNRSNGGANRDVDERVFLAVDWRNPINHHSRENRNGQTVEQEPWLNSISENLIDCFHLLVRGRMENDDD